MRALVLAVLSLAACSKEHPEKSPLAAAARPAPPPARAAEHAVFSLLDNRLLAHVERRGGLVALPGWPGFAKYLEFGKPSPGKLSWKLGRRKDDRRVGIADAYASLGVPLTEEQAAARAIYIRLANPTPRRLSIVVNGKNAVTQDLAAGWQTIAAQIPDGRLRAGENKVQLLFGKGEAAAVEWVQIGGTAPQNDDAEELAIADPAHRALLLAEGVKLVYYVMIPADGRLVGTVAGEGCKIAVSARAADGAAAAGELAGEAAAVELGALGGKVARLELTPAGCKLARLTGGALAIPGEAKVVAAPRRPSHVVLWIMDSLRADRVKPYFDQARPDVPTFTALAGKATLFKNTYVQGNESRSSHASIWSALYPVNHKVITAGAKLDASWVTLGEAMKAAGFTTSGVSSNGYIVARGGFGEGWDAYRNHIHDGGGLRGEDILEAGLASIDKLRESPFFLYLGTVDTHVSWRGKEPWLSKYDPLPYEGRFKTMASGADVDKMSAGELAVSARDKEHIIALYDSNVSYQDALLQKLLDQLTAWGIADETLVVVVADHGDEQWEDGRVGHGGSLRESLVRVPMLFYYPPLFPAGLVEEGAETVDILPTLLDAVGQSPPEQAQGASLIALAQGVGRGYPRPSIASQYEDAHAMRLGGWKARVAASGVPRVYHVDADPYEKRDLADERPLERRFLTDALSTFLVYQKDWKKARWGVASNMTSQMADELER